MPSGVGVRLLCVALVAVGLGGCAAFPQAATPHTSLPDLSRAERKPDVYAEVRLFRGQPDQTPEAITKGHGTMLASVKQAVSDSGLFHSVSFDEATRDKADFRLRVDVYETCNQGSTLAAEAVTAYTLGLVPVPTSQQFTVRVSLLDHNSSPVRAIQNTDGVRVWLGLWLLPVSSSHTLEAATSHTLTHQVQAGLTQLYDSGQMAAGYVMPAAPTGSVAAVQASKTAALPTKANPQ